MIVIVGSALCLVCVGVLYVWCVCECITVQDTIQTVISSQDTMFAIC